MQIKRWMIALLAGLTAAAAAELYPGNRVEFSGEKLNEVMTASPQSVTLKAGSAYRFTCKWTGNQTATAVVTCGPASSALELSVGERVRRLLFRVPAGKDWTQPVQVGIYSGSGTFAFSDFTLEQVVPIWNCAGALELGPGELLNGNQYAASGCGWDGDSLLRSVDQPVDYHSNAWFLTPERPLIFKHKLNARPLRSGSIKAWGWGWNNAKLTVAVSTDGSNYRTLAEYTQEHVEDLALPADLFPAEQVFIRYSLTPVNPAAPATINLANYQYKGDVDGEPMIMNGGRELVVLSDSAAGSLRITRFGQTPSGMIARGEFVNRSAAECRETPTLTLRREDGSVATLTGAELTIPPGQSRPFELLLSYGLGPAGKANFRLDWQPAGPSAAMQTFISPLYDARAGELLNSDADGAVWTASSAWKVSQLRRTPTKQGEAVTLSAARDEFESRQLVVTPKHEWKNFRITFSALRDADGREIPADSLDARYFAYLPIAAPSDNWGVADQWPDPLPAVPENGMTLEAGINHPFLVTVKVPKDAAAGIYQGVITLSSDDCRQEVPLRLRVFDFTLPETMTAVNNAGFSLEPAYYVHNLTDASPADKARMAKMYWELLRDARMSVPWPAQEADLKIEWPKLTADSNLDAVKVKVDWRDWDEKMARVVDEYHMNRYAFPAPIGFWAGGQLCQGGDIDGWALNTPQYKALASAYLREAEAHYREKGWLKNAFTYIFDEPPASQNPLIAEILGMCKKAAPGVRHFVTKMCDPAQVGLIDIWCPTAGAYPRETLQKMRDRRAAGDEVWWYMCGYPKAPCPSDNIDHPGIDMRTWVWVTWLEQLDGVMLWGSNTWGVKKEDYKSPTANPWRKSEVLDAVNNTWSNGDGRMIYPPLSAVDPANTAPIWEPPVPTQRLFMLRDGVEDYEYFVILRRLLAEKRARLSGEEYRSFEKLLQVSPAVTTAMDSYNWDPEPLEQQREKIGEAIEQLSR